MLFELCFIDFCIQLLLCSLFFYLNWLRIIISIVYLLLKPLYFLFIMLHWLLSCLNDTFDFHNQVIELVDVFRFLGVEIVVTFNSLHDLLIDLFSLLDCFLAVLIRLAMSLKLVFEGFDLLLECFFVVSLLDFLYLKHILGCSKIIVLFLQLCCFFRILHWLLFDFWVIFVSLVELIMLCLKFWKLFLECIKLLFRWW